MTGAHTLYTAGNTLGQVEDLLDDTVKQVRQYPTRDELNDVSNRSDRNRAVAISAALLLGIIAIVISAVTAYNQGQTAATTVINTSAIEALERAREDLREAGVPEESLPKLQETPLPNQSVDIGALINATTAAVLAKIKNDPAFRGETGATGEPGTPCDPVVNPACVGPKGETGEAGPPPTCESTPEGCRGRDGTNGDDAPVPANPRFVLATPEDPTTCVYRVDYVKPGTDEIVKTLDADVPDQFCA